MVIYMDLDALRALARLQNHSEASLGVLGRGVFDSLDRRLLLDLERYGISANGVGGELDDIAKGLGAVAEDLSESAAALRQHTERAWKLVTGALGGGVGPYLLGQFKIGADVVQAGEAAHEAQKWYQRVVATGPGIWQRVKTWRAGGYYATAGYGALGLIAAGGAALGNKPVELGGRWGQMGIMGAAWLRRGSDAHLFKGMKALGPVGLAFGVADTAAKFHTFNQDRSFDNGMRLASSAMNTAASAAFMFGGPVGVGIGVGLTAASLAIDTFMWGREWAQANPEKVKAIKETGQRVGKAVLGAVLSSPQVKLAGRVAGLFR